MGLTTSADFGLHLSLDTCWGDKWEIALECFAAVNNMVFLEETLVVLRSGNFQDILTGVDAVVATKARRCGTMPAA